VVNNLAATSLEALNETIPSGKFELKVVRLLAAFSNLLKNSFQ
jgi:hypothetical protein